MASTSAHAVNVPALISRRLPEICMRGHRSFSTCRFLRAEDNMKDTRPSSRRLVRDLNAKYRGIKPPEQELDAQLVHRERERFGVSASLQRLMGQAQAGQRPRTDLDTGIDDPHHIHVYSHRHNTHVTLTRPNRSPILSLSAGNMGFRHTKRGSFEAAFQLSSYFMGKMVEKGMLQEIKSIELVFRSFGAGREAFQKALLSNEGRLIKGLVTRVTDATRLKFGGTRSRNVRRL